MIATAFLLLTLTLAGQQPQVVVEGGPPPAPVPRNAPAKLPDTPQAKYVRAFIEAFNSGDEATFLKTQEAVMAAGTLASRPAEQRAKNYARMKGDFGTLKILRAVATAEQIRAVIPDKDGNEAIFSFDFDNKAPFKIKGLGVDIGRVER
jgi:hypothetical protein